MMTLLHLLTDLNISDHSEPLGAAAKHDEAESKCLVDANINCADNSGKCLLVIHIEFRNVFFFVNNC